MQILSCLAAPFLLVAAAVVQLFFEKSKKIPFYLLGSFLLLSLFGLFLAPKGFVPIKGYGFEVSSFTLLCFFFISFVSTIVYPYSLKYLSGDRKGEKFIFNLTLLSASLLLFIAADHLFLIALFWMSSNALLTLLMIHKKEWGEALASGRLFFKMALASFFCLSIGFYLIGCSFNTYSLHEIKAHFSGLSPLAYTGLVFVIIATLIQSGVWPFHRWLISSLNSPTPVSAFMHAGLINGGGLVIIRLCPLFAENQSLLDVIFMMGLISAFMGSLAKLVQPGIKNMLACSTLAQMGFMLMECGLGLFSFALVHVMCHGLFKGYLFLNSGSALEQSKTSAIGRKLGILPCIVASVASAMGVFLFCSLAFTSHMTLSAKFFIASITAISLWQMSFYVMQQRKGWQAIVAALASCALFGYSYGLFLDYVEKIPTMSSFMIPVSLSSIHILALVLFVIGALALIVWHSAPLISRRLYVAALNFGQSSKETKTLQRISDHLTRGGKSIWS